MKKLLILVCLICATAFAKAQTLADVKASPKLTWYGIDFSETRFLNFGGFLRQESMETNLNFWSYDPFGNDDADHWKKKFKKDELGVNIKSSHDRNHKTDFAQHMGTEPFEMKEEDLKKILSEYEISGNGYGLLFVPEKYDNVGTKKAYIWGVFINEADKTIINAEKFVVECYGDWNEAIKFGVRQCSRHLAKAK
ncbi:MAG: hypothetical protein H6551_11560 [Chitinophagales bacterium]|nr:hypothetical protein [Chitinophagaceae bacterium]MCB9065764.1 hypothetical protein [Chitinophagales bacterium]